MATHFLQRVAYEIDGEGDDVVMIHGLGGSSNTWTAILGTFTRNRVVRIDLPGSARSDRVDGDLSCEKFVTSVIDVMNAAKIDRAHVVAHSMGTIVAAHLAAQHPQRVRSMALFGPLLAPPDPARTALRGRAQKAKNEGAAGMQGIADALVQASTSAESRRSRLSAVALVRESLMRQCSNGYARNCEALANMQAVNTDLIKCPTLLVTGEDDVVAPPQSVRLMASKISGSHVEVIKGCGHWTPIETPELCMSYLNAFYPRVKSAARPAL
jgi:3-oxoadipate enol-lactonase